MRVYIISTQENIPFAEELLEDVQNVRVISHSIEEGIIANIDESTMSKIKDSDVVLAIVDKKFIGNTMLYMELEFALIWGKKTNIASNHFRWCYCTYFNRGNDVC